jgi:lysozyme family protein
MVTDMSAFEQAFTIVLGHEGGYSDDPADPGGRTKYGISARAYPRLDIGSLTLEDAQRIYERDYWLAAGCDLADPGLALVLFDAAVNCGVSQAVRWLQAALGVSVDGVLGPQTLQAIERCNNPVGTLAELHSARIHMMAGLPTWAKFGRGWSRRLALLPFQAAGMSEEKEQG